MSLWKSTSVVDYSIYYLNQARQSQYFLPHHQFHVSSTLEKCCKGNFTPYFSCFVCLFVFCFFEYAHMHVTSGGVFLAKPHGWENLVIYPSEKICYDVSVRPNADRTDSGGGGSQESARLGRSMKWLRWNVCISSTPLVSAVNHMATRTFKEKKNKSFFPLNFNVHINLDNTKRARARNE